MKIDFIINNFKKRGYKITRSLKSGKIYVTDPRGFIHNFESYNSAYMHYFKPMY